MEREDRIRQRAFEIWEREGRPEGLQKQHWLQAEREIEQEQDSAVETGRTSSDNAGTTDQLPRWEGPPENRPRGYLPAEDDPSTERDAAGENLQDPDRSGLEDAFTTKKSKER